MAKLPKDFLDLLRRYDRGVQELVLTLRDVILEELAPCFETIVEVYMISIVYASSERVMKDGICTPCALLCSCVPSGLLPPSVAPKRPKRIRGRRWRIALDLRWTSRL